MARIYSIDGIVPVVDPTAFVHPEAVLTGDVIVGPGCYIAPMASLRGDLGRIVVKAGANIQDSCVLHGFPGRDCIVEEDGHIGHGSVLHGCMIRRKALVGMNSVIMDGVEIGEASIVGAQSFVKAGLEVGVGKLVAGSPARVLRDLSEQEIAWKANGTRVYQDLASRSRATLQPATALEAPEPDRGRVHCDASEATPLHEVKRNT